MNQPCIYDSREDTELQETMTFGDILAVSLVGAYTFTALVLSFWSALLYFTGNTSNAGPVGFLFEKMFLGMIS